MKRPTVKTNSDATPGRDPSVSLAVNPPLPAIRFIVDTYCSFPDRYGNVDRWSRVTSTISGRSLSVLNVGGPTNIPNIVYRALDPQRPPDFDVWSWLRYSEHEVSRRHFTQPSGAISESLLATGPEIILDLEVRK